MFERFTPQARQVVVFAEEEARLLRRDQVGTEHLLVALARLEDDAAGAVLHAYGLTGEQARAAVARVVGVGEAGEGGERPFTAAARNALEAAVRESLELGHARIEPAHLLLGVLRQQDAAARRVLATVGAHPPQVRADIVERLAREREQAPGGDPADPVPVRLGETAIGDLGHPHVDGRLLLEILERRGAVGAWLREQGVDEQSVRRMLGH